MGHRTFANCIWRNDLGECVHPKYRRKSWLMRKLFGPNPLCVFDPIYFNPPASCAEQQERPRPAPPHPMRSGVLPRSTLVVVMPEGAKSPRQPCPTCGK